MNDNDEPKLLKIEFERLKHNVEHLERQLERRNLDDDDKVFGKSLKFWTNHAMVFFIFIMFAFVSVSVGALAIEALKDIFG